MNAGNKKSKPVSYFQKENTTGKLKNEEYINRKDNAEIKEVDDKLIGDDLDIMVAQQDVRNKALGLENEENNY